MRDGSQRALISAVPFRDDDFRMSSLPWLRLAFNQINYRASGSVSRRPGRLVLWNDAPRRPSSLSSGTHGGCHGTLRTSLLPLDGMTEFAPDDWLDAGGAWGTASLRCVGTTQAMGRLDGFGDSEQTGLILTHPLRGYYCRLLALIVCDLARTPEHVACGCSDRTLFGIREPRLNDTAGRRAFSPAAA